MLQTLSFSCIVSNVLFIKSKNVNVRCINVYNISSFNNNNKNFVQLLYILTFYLFFNYNIHLNSQIINKLVVAIFPYNRSTCRGLQLNRSYLYPPGIILSSFWAPCVMDGNILQTKTNVISDMSTGEMHYESVNKRLRTLVFFLAFL